MFHNTDLTYRISYYLFHSKGFYQLKKICHKRRKKAAHADLPFENAISLPVIYKKYQDKEFFYFLIHIVCVFWICDSKVLMSDTARQLAFSEGGQKRQPFMTV